MSNLTINSNQGKNLLQYLLKVSIKHLHITVSLGKISNLKVHLEASIGVWVCASQAIVFKGKE